MKKIAIKPAQKLTYLLLLTLLSVSISVSAETSEADQIKVPFKHTLGHQKFQQSCSVCHGSALQGTKQGPPLLHPYYKPSHHADFAFYRAALKGVTAHHWNFGDMPPVSGITRKDMDVIVPFIRWLQKEKGLFK